jgi:hypothetical protein
VVPHNGTCLDPRNGARAVRRQHRSAFFSSLVKRRPAQFGRSPASARVLQQWLRNKPSRIGISALVLAVTPAEAVKASIFLIALRLDRHLLLAVSLDGSTF